MSQLVDVVDKITRSRMMSGIRSKNTKPELLTRSALHRRGYRFRLDSKVKVKGQKNKIKPDIVLPRHNVVIFIHSCFFHQHPGCQLAYSDRTYSEYWLQKFQTNKNRDSRQIKQLWETGWRVAVIWECGTRDKKEFDKIINNVDQFIKEEKQIFYESLYKK